MQVTDIYSLQYLSALPIQKQAKTENGKPLKSGKTNHADITMKHFSYNPETEIMYFKNGPTGLGQ